MLEETKLKIMIYGSLAALGFAFFMNACHFVGNW